MNYNVVLENKVGEAIYRYIYIDETGYMAPIDVMKRRNVLIFNLDDIHLAIGYKSKSRNLYNKLDNGYIYNKFIPGKDPRTNEYTDIANLEIFVKNSRKPEARRLLKWIKESVMVDSKILEETMKDHLEKVYPKEELSENEEEEIDIELLTDSILSNSGVRKAIMNVLKSKLK